MKKLFNLLMVAVLVFVGLAGCGGATTIQDFEEEFNEYLQDVQHANLVYESQGINAYGKPTMNYDIYQNGLPVGYLYVEYADGEHVSNITLTTTSNSVEMAEAFFEEMEDIANIDFENVQTFHEAGFYNITTLNLLGGELM